ncbi:unnamed protein product, partial [Ectocarpus sp. 12 AP-2014]
MGNARSRLTGRHCVTSCTDGSPAAVWTKPWTRLWVRTTCTCTTSSSCACSITPGAATSRRTSCPRYPQASAGRWCTRRRRCPRPPLPRQRRSRRRRRRRYPVAPGAAATASLPFQGKRAEGLLLNAEGYAVDGSSLSAAPLKTEFGGADKPATQAPGVAKTETTAARSGLTAAAAPSAGDDAVSSPGGERRRDDDRIPRGERGGVDCPVEAELLSRDAQLLEDEIEASFGTGSDLWHPWSSREEWGSGRLERSSSRGVKRPAPVSQETNSTGCYANKRDTKSLKTEGGVAAAAAGGGGSAANGALHCPDPPPARALASSKGAAPALEQAAARAAAEQLSPSHRSQRVPGARALAPFLQAVTASQKMKVSHEVCRVMTAGVK